MDKQKEINIFKTLFLIALIIVLISYLGWTLKKGELIGPPLAQKGFGATIVILLYCIYLLYKEAKKIISMLFKTKGSYLKKQENLGDGSDNRNDRK